LFSKVFWALSFLSALLVIWGWAKSYLAPTEAAYGVGPYEVFFRCYRGDASFGSGTVVTEELSTRGWSTLPVSSSTGLHFRTPFGQPELGTASCWIAYGTFNEIIDVSAEYHSAYKGRALVVSFKLVIITIVGLCVFGYIAEIGIRASKRRSILNAEDKEVKEKGRDRRGHSE
jgi:hypothetical protein